MRREGRCALPLLVPACRPRVEGDCEGWHRVTVEPVAYKLALNLGMDVVPPAVFCPTAEVDWQHFPNGGTFIYWAHHSCELSHVPQREWSIKEAVLLSDTRILVGGWVGERGLGHMAARPTMLLGRPRQTRIA